MFPSYHIRVADNPQFASVETCWNILRSEVLMAVNMLTVAFWVVMPCNLVDGYQHLRKMYCQHFQFLNSETAYSPEALVATYKTTCCHNPQVHD
jgi:hypothetical protein